MNLSRNHFFPQKYRTNASRHEKKKIFLNYKRRKIFSRAQKAKKKRVKIFLSNWNAVESELWVKIRGWPHIKCKKILTSDIIYYLWHTMWLLHKSPSPSSHTECHKQLSYKHELSNIFFDSHLDVILWQVFFISHFRSHFFVG